MGHSSYLEKSSFSKYPHNLPPYFLCSEPLLKTFLILTLKYWPLSKCFWSSSSMLFFHSTYISF